MLVTITNYAVADTLKEQMCRTLALISAKVSPDGKRIAQVGADELGIANVFILYNEDTHPIPKQLSFFKTPEIIQFFWSADSKKVLLLKDDNGKGQLHLYGFDVHSKKQISYTENFSKVNVKVLKISSKENKAIIGINHRNAHFHDLYTLDLNSGDLTLLLQNDTFAKFLISDELQPILKMQINGNGSWTILTHNNDLFMNLSPEDAFQTEFISYDSTSNAVYFLDNRFSDTNQLTKKLLCYPYEEKVLGGQPHSDIDEVIFENGKPKAYASYHTQKTWHLLDSAIGGDIAFLEKQIGANFELISKCQNDQLWIVSNSIPDQGTYFWKYRKNPRSLIQLSSLNDESSLKKDLSKMYPMIVTTRDGKKLVCYYTLPKEDDKGGYVDAPLPLVVVPHGGPFKVRDKFEFNRYHQWLASCGYAVLSVNFRLSSGFGKAFVNAGNGEWGGKAHLDVIDAAEACIAKKITERGKLAIFGGSYGGYESLAALTFTPEYFTCCIAICGPSNLKTVLGSVPEFWEFTSSPLSDKTIFFTKQAFIMSMGGNPEEEMGAKYLEKCSPLNYLDRIKIPLLLIHGKNDHVVTEEESKQIYECMKKNNKDVTYILFPNEGHRFSHFPNKMISLDQAELFLSKHLHGRYEPSDKKLLAGSTAQFFN